MVSAVLPSVFHTSWSTSATTTSPARWFLFFIVLQVVKHFLKLASDRASAAREESEQAVLHEVEDLDVLMTPEK